MAISSITLSDFIIMTSMKKSQLFSILKGKSVMEALKFRRDFQIAMTDYRKTVGRNEERCMRGISVCQWVEKLCRLRAMPQLMSIVKNEMPELKHSSVKIEAKRRWEDLVKRNSF